MNEVAFEGRGVDDPLGQHAPALPTDGRDQQAEQLRLTHEVAAANRSMTASRMWSSQRRQRLGFVTIFTS